MKNLSLHRTHRLKTLCIAGQTLSHTLLLGMGFVATINSSMAHDSPQAMPTAFTPQSFPALTSHAQTMDMPSMDLTTLPTLGSDGTRFVDSTEHIAVGKWSLQHLNGSMPILNDAWTQQILETMAWDINAHAGLAAPQALVVVNSPQINAFAIPGGVMGINAGTVMAANSMDEVASVVAHEVAHLSQRHYEARQDAGKKALMMQIGGLLAAIAASTADGGGDAAAAMMLGSQTLAQESQMAFSRSNEREADRVGMALMAKAGYDPAAMPRFFATLNAQTQLNQSKNQFLPSFIMTHPLSLERLSEAQSRAATYQAQYPAQHLHKSPMADELTFAVLKWRLQVLTEQTGEAALKTATSQGSQESRIGAMLALALWYVNDNRYFEAQALLDETQVRLQHWAKQVSGEGDLDEDAITAINPTVAIVATIIQADLYGSQGQWQQAVNLLASQQQVFPERRDLAIELANAYIGLSKTAKDAKQADASAQKALALLKPQLKRQPNDVLTLGLLEATYLTMGGAMGNTMANGSVAMTATEVAQQTITTAQSLRYRALKHLWHARYEEALVAMNRAILTLKNQQGSPHASFEPLIAVLTAELDTIKKAKAFKP